MLYYFEWLFWLHPSFFIHFYRILSDPRKERNLQPFLDEVDKFSVETHALGYRYPQSNERRRVYGKP